MFGLDLLGLGSPNWNLAETINAFPSGWAVGVFDNTWPHAFGDPIPNLKKLINTGKISAVRVHIWWSYQHKLVPLDILIRRLPVWEQMAKDNPNIKFYISPSCEYQESSVKEIKSRVEAVKNLAPSCIPVLAPMKSPVIPGTIKESHGKDAIVKSGGIASTDGDSLSDIDAAKWVGKNKEAEICFLWASLFNMLEAHNVAMPDKRTASPSAKYITAITRLAETPEPPPSVDFESTPIKKPLLYKLFAEDLPGQNPRDNKPLIILPIKAKTIDIITKDKEPIGTLGFFGGYLPNLFRYYSGWTNGINKYGYEISDLSIKISGSPYVWFRGGNKYFGPVHPSFRTGYFR